ncbi:4-hydroxyproline betaine 2-epimerase [Pelagimonas phthalicica]|uniref:4-hydroxyproline betaine 2-epimerase n=1 Tax=Pelagimonas phthalicica TaxID=1037362 RepID=A0A238JEI3_9RHOB|nr:mandelate racemase/muconate lactonizing enzyme family protein [Pelagimonas phthalicica]TDS91754.1 L-alanine-DL-glutamate epimerase-like enolase superfamily enzyme [Pelagimonas phthalicica]SMX28803.1 4-hydroxyproline betaine 2-epimerase [Pelagimonas phthalicica]
MKISRLSLWSCDLTSHETYHMSEGKTCDTVKTHILCLEADTGLKGWGEVCPIPHYLPAFADGVPSAVTEMAPEILGQSPLGVDSLMHRLDKYLIGHSFAKSLVDMALWDLFGKAVDQPLYALLGGRMQADMPLYHSITCIAPDDMARIAREAYGTGIRQFQVKLGADQDWQADAERLIKVREAVGDGPLVYGDWNCGATKLQATRTGRAVAHLDIMLEQPCKTLEDCAAVRQATGLPMKVDENAFDMASLLRAADLGVLDAVALKLSKFGGLSAMRRARDLTVHLGAEICAECTWGSDIVTAAALHFAASTPPNALLNTCDLSSYVGPRIAPDGPTRKNGRIAPPKGPGLGVSPDLDFLGSPLLELA